MCVIAPRQRPVTKCPPGFRFQCLLFLILIIYLFPKNKDLNRNSNDTNDNNNGDDDDDDDFGGGGGCGGGGVVCFHCLHFLLLSLCAMAPRKKGPSQSAP